MHDIAGFINLATGALTSVREFVETAASALDLPAERLRFGEVAAGRFDVPQGPPSVARCRELLGWVPTTSIREGVRRTADWTDAEAQV